MRKAFFEYYGLTPEELTDLWDNGLIVFDTNVLLSLYRRSKDAREDILSVMKGFSDRLWLPHQVGSEFHERRLSEAIRPIESIKELSSKLEKSRDTICREYENNPYVSCKFIKDSFNALIKRIQKKADEWLETCPSFLNDDIILSQLTILYDGKVGEVYDESRLKEIYKEGEDRYSRSIPPGYKDANKEGEKHRFGDLIIWLQIIDKAKELRKGIIFITDDQKEDWWELFKGDKIGPRKELIREFRKITGNQIICFYTTDRFLSYAKEKSGMSIKKKTIEEVKMPSEYLESLARILADNSKPGQVSFPQFDTTMLDSMHESKAFEDLSSSLLRIKNLNPILENYFKTPNYKALDDYAAAMKEIKRQSSLLGSSADNDTRSNGTEQPGSTSDDPNNMNPDKKSE